MSEKVDRELRELFAEAEACGACLRPPEERVRAACARRAGEDGELVSPAHGLYARRTWWDALGYSAQTLAIMRSLQADHPDWVFCGPSAALALGCDVAVSVTGIAGPGGAEPGKPVGTVWLGLATPGGARSLLCRFGGDRAEVRRQAVRRALALLREGVVETDRGA